MTRINASELKSHVRAKAEALAGRQTTERRGKRRGEMGKWERSFAKECFILPVAANYEAIRLRVGAGADGLRAAWYTPDYMTSPCNVRPDLWPAEGGMRPVLVEVKGSRQMRNARASLVAFRAAAQQYGGWFRFGLAEGGPGRWRITWMD